MNKKEVLSLLQVVGRATWDFGPGNTKACLNARELVLMACQVLRSDPVTDEEAPVKDLPELDEVEKRLVREVSLVSAVRAYRLRTGLMLLESAEKVEEYRATLESREQTKK